MEALYFIVLAPSFVFISLIGTSVILISFILQAFLIISSILILRRKIKNNSEKTFGFDLKKWIVLSFVVYSGAIWVNHVSRWFDMTLIGRIPMLLTSLNPLGVFNSTVILYLPVIFGIISYLKIKKSGSLSKWFGLSMTMLGLHFIILVIFYALQDSLNALYLFEIWTIPLFGLGLSIIFNNNK